MSFLGGGFPGKTSIKKMGFILPFLIIVIYSFQCAHNNLTDSDDESLIIEIGEKITVIENFAIQSGTIKIEKENCPINGLEITIPDGAYSEIKRFSIGYAPVTRDNFDNQIVLSPLIYLTNREESASKFITIKIPAHIPEGYFPMGFFYNSAENTLHGIKSFQSAPGYISLITASIDNVMILAIKKSVLMECEINTGFEQGKDNWLFPNKGSYISPGGHCAGQNLTAIWYYNKKRIKGEKQLNGLYDNNSSEPTPELWEDDSWGYRLASVVQKDIDWHNVEMSKWDNIYTNLSLAAIFAEAKVT